MSRRSKGPEGLDALREKIIGLGERSFRKSYYPKLRQQLMDLGRAEELVRETARRQQAILDSIPDMAWMKDSEGRYIAANDAYGKAAAMNPADIAGKTDLDIWPANLAKKIMADDREVMRTGKRMIIEESLRDRQGNVKWYETIKTAIFSVTGLVSGTTGIARDITRRKQMEETIKYQAHHDLLTGLANKALLMDHLRLELAQMRRLRKRLAVCFLDLDRFKNINDAFGHAEGDLLLKEVAGRLLSCLRDIDTIGRFGGDEFTILLPLVERPDDALKTAEKIMGVLKKPFVIGAHEIDVTASIGISVFPDDGENPEALLKNADAAMYYAKNQGRNNYQFFNSALNMRTLERVLFENRLRRAVEQGELVVHYQPQVNMKTKLIIGAEALARWSHPELGLLAPAMFIPLAEEIGLITRIDQWVMQTACAQLRQWQSAGYPLRFVTVNLSARQFEQPNLAERVSEILLETSLSPSCLGIEITETLAMRDTDLAIRNLSSLGGLGVWFSIDDFGTGYSSLSRLKKLPIHKLKIDKSFVFDLPVDPDRQAIIDAIIAMAHILKLAVVAEGVETEAQMSFLSSKECDEAQGNFCGRPVTAKEFGSLMAAGK
ncbi:MAG: EAL domain-containing protein [Nitrospiraceae bacterium]|nr:EAL domain-containing protein [Nitrospiraceae bacterium]